MKDDGQHGDGGSGDGVFGAEMPIQSVLNEYFVYAENADAGIFSPRRAEYEFHELTAEAPQLQPGDVVINEFLATNSAANTDPDGNFSDWVELYNNANEPRNLSGAFLSDDFTKPKKWAIPDNTVIPANGFLLIWANGGSNSPGIHAGFKLSGAGEQLAFTTSDGTTRLDSLEFGQQSTDKSMGRCPNGTGSFAVQPVNTPGAVNCVVSIENTIDFVEKLIISPNPANDFLEIKTTEERPFSVQIFNSLGQLIFNKNELVHNELIDISNWPVGVYFTKNFYREIGGFYKKLNSD